ncbi:MAG: OmpA family protein, partial [Myxococcota bacterium]
ARSTVAGEVGTVSGGSDQRFELAPGAYHVTGSAAGYDPVSQDVTVGPDGASVDLVVTPSAGAKIVVSRDKIDLRESIRFRTASATIDPASFPLLDQVVTVLRDYPEIRKLRIEGHTDSRGADATNLALSTSRAASVRQYLVDHGIAGDRLTSEGFGETRPLDPSETPDAWAKNRRVDLVVETWAE